MTYYWTAYPLPSFVGPFRHRGTTWVRVVNLRLELKRVYLVVSEMVLVDCFGVLETVYLGPSRRGVLSNSVLFNQVSTVDYVWGEP